MSYHIVDFHADGGQMCVPGRRSFTDPEEAGQFAEKMRREPGHVCGPNSVKEYTSETDLGNEGAVYPGVANPEDVANISPLTPSTSVGGFFYLQHLHLFP